MRLFDLNPLTYPDGTLFFLIIEWSALFILVIFERIFKNYLLFVANDINFTYSLHDTWIGVFGFIVGLGVFTVSSPLLRDIGLATTSVGIYKLSLIPLSIRILIVFTAGVTEEFLYRGYSIEYLYKYTGDIKIAALIPTTVFILMHLLTWGLGGTIQIGLWTLVILTIYLKRRNLYPCILMHILNDAFAFILLPIFR